MGRTAAQPSSPLFERYWGCFFLGGDEMGTTYSLFTVRLSHFVTIVASVSIASRGVSYTAKAARKMEENF